MLGVVLHQKVLGPHKHGDEDAPGLLSVGAVPLIHTGDPASAGVHRTEEATVSGGARPALPAAVHRAPGVTVREAAENKTRVVFLYLRGHLLYFETQFMAVTQKYGPKSLAMFSCIMSCTWTSRKHGPSVSLPPHFEKSYAADATGMPGPRAPERSVVILSWAFEIIS